MKFSNTFRIVWWFSLVGPLTYVVGSRFSSYTSGRATVVDLGLLVIWAILFLAPVYAEISVGGVALKQHIENAKDEIRADVGALRAQLQNVVDIETNFAPQVNITAPSPIWKLPEIEEQIHAAVDAALRARDQAQAALPTPGAIGEVPADVQFMFVVRYEIERELRRIEAANPFLVSAPARRPISGPQLAAQLASQGLLDKRLVPGIRETYAVCSRAIHGEDLDQEQVQFVRDVGPGIVAALKATE